MKRLTLVLALLILPATMEGQTVCFQYSGGVISCDSSRGNVTQVPLTRSQGLLQTDGVVEPYTIMPSTPEPPSGFSSRPIEPLRRLDWLDRLDRHDDPLRDPLLAPLLLGE